MQQQQQKPCMSKHGCVLKYAGARQWAGLGYVSDACPWCSEWGETDKIGEKTLVAIAELVKNNNSSDGDLTYFINFISL